MSRTHGRPPRRGNSAREGARGDARAASASSTPESTSTVTIERIAAGGDGVARNDGLVVFVPRTAPGDVVQVAVRMQGRLGRGRVLQLLTPSPARVAPQCRHYVDDACGGCQLQHLHEDAQRDARRHIVQDAMARIGKRDIALPPLTSGASWYYRGRLTLHLHRKGSRWVGGLHPAGDASRVFALHECAIVHPTLITAWHAVRDVMGSVPMPTATALRLGLRLGVDDGTVVHVVVQGGVSWPAFSDFQETLARSLPGASVWWIDAHRDAHGQLRAAEGDATLALISTEVPDVEHDGADETGPAAEEALAFAQVNGEIAEQLRALVERQIVAFTPTHVLDAYAGSGVLAERLALAGVRVTTIESDAAGVRAMQTRLRARGEAVASRVTAIRDYVERALPRLAQTTGAEAVAGAALAPDIVLLNPPRRGVDRAVTDWLEHAPSRVRGLVYVSCDPATLARDLARMPSWRIAHVECFDMFPQTAHVETVCILHREVA